MSSKQKAEPGTSQERGQSALQQADIATLLPLLQSLQQQQQPPQQPSNINIINTNDSLSAKIQTLLAAHALTQQANSPAPLAASLLQPLLHHQQPQSMPTPTDLQAQTLSALHQKILAAASAAAAVASTTSSSVAPNTLAGAPVGSLTPPRQHPRTPPPTSLPPASNSVSKSVTAQASSEDQAVIDIEQEMELYQKLNQPVPHRLQLLLAEAKRKQARKEAKRVANRRSASTSRARKKAFVEEITALNNHLKRHALILSLLPDLVFVVDEDANITFSSGQVERVLRRSVEELVGTSLYSIVDAASKDKLRRLLQTLLKVSEKDDSSDRKGSPVQDNIADANDDAGNKRNGKRSAEDEAMVVSDRSVPLSVVNVEAKSETVNESSDTSTSKPDSKATSSLTNGGSSDEGKKSVRMLSSDNSSNDVTVADVKTSDGKDLERNVRLHNRKLKDNVLEQYTDDVTGEAVTANNADARLSSLQVRAESSSETDSGYRESNESREDTASSASDSSASGGRGKPFGPTCVVNLVRKDLSTIWCEVTSSVRSMDPPEPSSSDPTIDGRISKSETSDPLDFDEGGSASVQPRAREFLLCLRPIREGGKSSRKKYKFSSKNLSASESKDSASGEMHSRSDEGDSSSPRKRPKTGL